MTEFSISSALMVLRLRRKKGSQENPGPTFNGDFERRENLAIRQEKLGKASFQEKSLRLNMWKPYRKPTQVIRSSRPRRTSDRFSRNSAKKRP